MQKIELVLLPNALQRYSLLVYVLNLKFSLDINLLEKKNTNSAMYGMGLQTTRFVKNFEAAMHTREKSVRIAGQSFTAQEAVLQMRIMQVVLSAVFMNRDVNFFGNVWNVQL